MDTFVEYIWRRRIHHAVRYKKRDVLYPECVQLGLEFNGALEKKEKFDVSLLTNAVVLELWDFAKCVSGSGVKFLFEILELNFDLGVDAMSEAQYCAFRKEVHVKAKGMCMIKRKPEKLEETFPLPQLVDEEASAGTEQREMNMKETFDVSLLTAGSSDTRSSENQKSNRGDVLLKQRGRAPSKLTHDSFPRCKELGVKLFIQEENAPKEKLHTDRLTKGVMMELLSFSSLLCGSCSGIACDLVKLNFGQELSQALFLSQVNRIVEKKRNGQEALDKKPFLPQSRKKRKRPGKGDQDEDGLLVPSKRLSSLRDLESNGTEMCQDEDLSYMCPVDFEAEILSDAETEREKTTSVSCTSETSVETTVEVEETTVGSADKVAVAVGEKSSQEMVSEVIVKEEEEEVFVSSVQPQRKGSDSQLPGTHLALTAVSDLFSADKHQDHTVTTPKQRFWIRRALRSQHILQSMRVTDRFASCRAVGFDFNVGAGSRQKLSLQLFTNGVMVEVLKFATSMQKSVQGFLTEILENNFKILFQDEAQQRYFVTAMVAREKFYQSHTNKHTAEYLNHPYTMTESAYTVDVERDSQTGEAFGDERGELDSETCAATEQEDSDEHPFCRKLGLDLWSTERRPASRKLDLPALTRGAAMEMMSFARYLCGNVRKTIMDVLEHNFDLNLQDPNSDDKKALERWFCKHRNVMSKWPISKKKKAWLKELLHVRPAPEHQQQPKLDIRPQDLDRKDSSPASKGIVASPWSEYNACREIGLRLSFSTRRTTRRKLPLGLLTRKVLFDIHQYVMRNSGQYTPALYQVLENNFDLSSQIHRKVEFAWAVSSQVLGIAKKVGRRGSYLDTVVELPLEYSQVVCKEEPEDDFTEPDCWEKSDVKFVRELKPVDIEVEIE